MIGPSEPLDGVERLLVAREVRMQIRRVLAALAVLAFSVGALEIAAQQKNDNKNQPKRSKTEQQDIDLTVAMVDRVIQGSMPAPADYTVAWESNHFTKGQDGQTYTPYTIVVDKSTVPVGTAARVQHAISAETRVEFDVVANPEFLKEGEAIEAFTKPDRVVIGTHSERARAVLAALRQRHRKAADTQATVLAAWEAEVVQAGCIARPRSAERPACQWKRHSEPAAIPGFARFPHAASWRLHLSPRSRC